MEVIEEDVQSIQVKIGSFVIKAHEAADDLWCYDVFHGDTIFISGPKIMRHVTARTKSAALLEALLKLEDWLHKNHIEAQAAVKTQTNT